MKNKEKIKKFNNEKKFKLFFFHATSSFNFFQKV